ncbi:OmpH family outer membrane protein [Allosphingosinicella sp.]|uniref:OmpH family outer membrane protein n=1 Tax=Allosphingosinicella sp. TaxID=2823234 RepID=UPI002FC2334D
MNKFVFGAALAALATAIPASAPAQRLGGAVIAVVDVEQVMAQCTACVAARTQLQQQLQQAEGRAQQLSQPLETEAQSIQQALAALGGKQPDAALTQRIQALQTKQNSARQELGGRQRTLQSTEAHVNQQIAARLGPIINQVMQTRGATVVLNKGNTLAASASIDVTNDVLAQLNQQLPSVSVTPLPQQQTQQQQPQGR